MLEAEDVMIIGAPGRTAFEANSMPRYLSCQEPFKKRLVGKNDFDNHLHCRKGGSVCGEEACLIPSRRPESPGWSCVVDCKFVLWYRAKSL